MTNDINKRNKRTALIIFIIVAEMVGFAYVSVPLYKLFCQVTGFGGQAQVDAANRGEVRDRIVTVRFNTDVDQNLSWTFKPDQNIVKAQVGVDNLVSYTAQNTSNASITGTATYNVAPIKAGQYFHKTQCFCFGQQTLNAGQKTSFPVIFYIDPKFADDPNMQDVESVTLSYTFFKADTPALEQALEAFYNTPTK